MFDKILPPIYRKLRRRAGLSQAQLATQLDVSRHTLGNYESGKTRPDPGLERRLVELGQCSKEQLVELVCEQLSEEVGSRVAIIEGDYRPTTVVSRAERALRALRGQVSECQVPDATLRRLADKIHVTQLMCLAFERQIAGLEELTHDCTTAAGPDAAGPDAAGPDAAA
ncbi:MAG: helix-turn-helix transcriptional regulator [bacterium]|nr:helix-turn-helix transcriptional regulator [bacterium]